MSRDTACLLSLVIPTRNRYDTLKPCLRALGSFKVNFAWEIIVYDTSDEYINIEYSNKNVVYVKGKADGFSDTFSRAMDHCSGKYVSYIGDDDCVTSLLFSVVEWMEENSVDTLGSRGIASYIWPSVKRTIAGKEDSDVLRILDHSSIIQKEDCSIELKKCIRDGFQNMHRMPKIYHGIVRRELMNRIKAECGDYFLGSSPDIFAAIALTKYSKEHYFIDDIITIHGSSAKSAAGASIVGSHFGELRGSPLEQFEKGWPDSLPRLYSVQTMWAFTGLLALSATSRSELSMFFNYKKLLGNMIAYNPKHSIRIFKNINTSAPKISLIEAIYYSVPYFTHRSFRLAARVFEKSDSELALETYGLKSIEVALSEVETFIKRKYINAKK